MKSEERHQLLQNDLGVVTTKTVGFFERHLGTLIAVVCGAILLAAAAAYLTRATESENAAGWTMLDSANNSNSLEDLGDVADKFKGKPPGQWAQLEIAEKTLQNAMPLMFSNREIALTDLKHCREGFESLLQDKSVSPLIRERALWGLALCLETGCDGDTSKPIQAFERLITEFHDSIFEGVAEERIAALKKKGASEFYAWFSQEKPKPAEAARPKDVQPDGHHLPAPSDPDDDPDFDAKMPIKKPALPNDKPDADKPAEADKPSEGEKPPGTEPPKSDDKSDDKKSDDKK